MIKIVKYIDIHKAIVSRIKTKFPNIVFSKDIEKGITRPSFFIDFDNIKVSDFMNEAQDKSLTVRIYYFSTTVDGNKIELLKMYDDLIDLLLNDNLIVVDENIKFEVEELEISVVDKVLHCYFDVRISEEYNRIDNTPVIEDLEVRIERKG